MVSREQIRSELLAAYRNRRQDRFREFLLRGLTDPIDPLTETKRRRFHPVFITAALLTTLCLVVAAILSW